MTNHKLFLISIFALVLACSSCNTPQAPPATPDNFKAEVSGSIQGKVSGPGVVTFIPPSENLAGSRPGYFFIADDTGVRDIGITFTIPLGTKPGKYQLVSAGPLDVGTKFSVRLDRSIESRTESFQDNTTGTMTLKEFPQDSSKIKGTSVQGTFDFTTAGKDGEKVTATGEFGFQG